jgi:transaldolase
MKIFIDTANLDEIREANSWGIIDGVTTNPSLIKKALDYEKEKGKKIDMEGYIRDICETVGSGKPVSLEVISLTAAKMVDEARSLYEKFDPVAGNVVIKIPINTYDAHEGNFESLKTIKKLRNEGIPTNATLIMTPEQALIAAKAGARYASPFAGRVDDYVRKNFGMKFEKGDYFDFSLMKEMVAKSEIDIRKDWTKNRGIWSGVDLVEKIMKIYSNYNFDTEVIAASIRNERQAREMAELGVDIATIPFEVIKKMLEHYKTEEGVKKFSEDVVPEYRNLFRNRKF